MRDSLQIFTLGNLQIKRNGALLTGFATRKVEALLVYLVCTRTTHARSTLAELLWQDRSTEQSLANLRAALSRLGQQVGPFLDVNRQTLAVSLEADIWLDVTELQAALASLSLAEHRVLPSAIEKAEQALTLFRGDFLDGFSVDESRGFEEWVSVQREYLRSQVIDGLSRIVSYYLERRDTARGLPHASRLIALDPLREESHRQLMLLLAQSGQRAAALVQFETVRQILDSELGIEPEAETTTLYERILTGELPAHAPHQQNQPLHNLSTPSTRLVGREDELVRIAEYLRDPDCRLLTLVGPGGIGKTRLALQAAESLLPEFAGGVWVIALAGTSANGLLTAIAQTLNITFYTGDNLREQLISHLREKEILLVMDNCEHLVDEIGLLSELLGGAPRVKILATSRERLNLQSEWLMEVPGLSFPAADTNENLDSYPAIELFVHTARRTKPGYKLDDPRSAAEICALVEGLPLAIELAASWTQQVTCKRIAEGIRHDLAFLTTRWRDMPERHRNLQALFEYSFNLLTDVEQAVFRKLAVFHGGFDLEAAERIAGASLPVLTALVDKSLVRGSVVGRYDLHPLIRQYAEAQLRRVGDDQAAREQHLAYFVRWAELADDRLHGPEQMVWSQRFQAERDNLRVALEWAFNDDNREESREKAELGLRLANALGYFWQSRGEWREAYQWLQLGLKAAVIETPTHAYATQSCLTLSGRLGDLAGMPHWMKETERLAEQFDLDDVRASLLVIRSFGSHDYQAIGGLFEEAIALLHKRPNHSRLALVLRHYGDRARLHGDLQKAEALYSESVEICRSKQDSGGMAAPLGNLGRLAIHRGDYGRGAALIGETIEIYRGLGSRPTTAEWLVHLGTLAIYQGQYDEAARLLEETLMIWHEVGNSMGIIHATYCLGDLALHQGDYERAATLLNQSLSLSKRPTGNFSEYEFIINELIIVGKLCLVTHDYLNSARLFGAVTALKQKYGYLLEPLPQAEFEKALTDIRSHVDESMFLVEWETGRALSEEQAIAHARILLQRTQASG